ncbi:uncharacterized protein LAJ45_05316 [Morchella importuna]|uniref:uncharacterized protein n=1 Tax=Morchella importuna TaxID=1174673 RepID=UPI001E8D8DF4|nr:uncharacterized protein LAJ45_05316 [Morchella importuna]KAH8150620.1 hypothetical protein LAJ45_05316 [Morchella importuna]
MSASSLTEAWSLDLTPATTSAPFITLLSSACLPAANFNTWLRNDYIYVHAGTHFLAHLICSLPPTTKLHPLLIAGYITLLSELSLFRSKAAARGVALPALPAPHPDPGVEAARDPMEVLAELTPTAAEGCVVYMRFLMELCVEGGAHWMTLLAVLSICEKVYLDAMITVRESEAFKSGALDENVRGFVEWWSSKEFSEYVGVLEAEAAAVRGGEGWREDEARAAVERAIVLEVGFWAIATEGLEGQ